MLLAWDRSLGPPKRLALLFLVAGFVVIAGAQEPPKARVPVPRTIILPLKMVTGTTATLAVIDSAGRLLPNVVVELSSGQKVTTNATGRAQLLAPDDPGKFIAKIAGKEIFAISTVAAPADSAIRSPADGSPDTVRVVSYPHALVIHDRFTMEGTGFRGAADSDHVFLADQQCLVVASSPVSLVVLPGPHVPIGAIRLRVSIAGHDTVEIPVSAVLLEFSGPTEAPDAGTQGKILLTVHGSTERLGVEVFNGSPRIIEFPNGNVQRVTTSGGEENIAPVELKFLAAGNYTITAKLVPDDSGDLPERTSSGMNDAGQTPGPARRP
jgi:hypothetical protein